MGALAPVALAVSAIGTVAGGVAQRDAAYRSAAVDEENARLAILSGEQDALALRREERFRAGESLAGQGGNGLLTGGSITTLIEQSAFERELEIAGMRQRAYGEASNYQTRASESVKAGNNALIGSLFGAVSGALEGANGIRNQRRLEAQRRRESKHRRGTTTNHKRYKGAGG